MKRKAGIAFSVIAIFSACAIFQPAFSTPISLLGLWDVVGSDVYPYNALLEFTIQAPQGNGAHLEGYFIWNQIGGPRGGTELFEGTLFSDFSLLLHGTRLFNAYGIGLATYLGTVSTGGDYMSGTWSTPAGVWTANRRDSSAPIPEPGSFVLLSLGVTGLLWVKRNFYKR